MDNFFTGALIGLGVAIGVWFLGCLVAEVKEMFIRFLIHLMRDK